MSEDELVAIHVLSGTIVRKLQSYGLPVTWDHPAGQRSSTRVESWLRELLSVGLQIDDVLFAALVRVRDDPELRKACLAAVRMAPEENCGKAVALGRLLGVPLPAWMEAGVTFREYGGQYGKNRPPDPVSAILPEPAEAHPWPF